MEQREQSTLTVSADAGQADMDHVARRIELLEAELGQQRQNFEHVDRRFDQLGSQLAALCDAISGTHQQASQTPDQMPSQVLDRGANKAEIQLNTSLRHLDTLVRDEVEATVEDAMPDDVSNDSMEAEVEFGDRSDEAACNPENEVVCLNHSDSNGAKDPAPMVSRIDSPTSIHDESGLDQLLARLNSAASPGTAKVDGDAPTESQNFEPVLDKLDHQDEFQKSKTNELEDLFASLHSRESSCQNSADDSSGQPASCESRAMISADLVETGDCAENESTESTESTEMTESNCDESASGSTDMTANPHEEGVAEIMARMNCLTDLEDLNPDATGADPDENTAVLYSGSPPADSPAFEPESEPVAVAPAHGDGAGADVQDYMNSLLQRLNGGRSSSSAPKVEKAAPKTKPEPPTRKVVVEQTQSVVSPLGPDEFVPKRVAPEKTKNLAAMRELANATSRSAVKSSEARRKKGKANFQLALAGGGIAGAAFMACLSTGMGDMFCYLAVGLLAMAAAASYYYTKTNIIGKTAKPADNYEAETSPPAAASLDWSKLGELKDSFMAKLNRNPEESS